MILQHKLVSDWRLLKWDQCFPKDFTILLCDTMIAGYMLLTCLSVCLCLSMCHSVCGCVCMSHAGIVLKWLNVGSRRYRHMIARHSGFLIPKVLRNSNGMCVYSLSYRSSCNEWPWVSLKVIPLLHAFSSVIFRICGASCSPSASAELFVSVALECSICNTTEENCWSAKTTSCRWWYS